VLGEPFNTWIAAGTALVVSGVWLLARRKETPALQGKRP